MNIIDLEAPTNTEKFMAPETNDEHSFYITEYGKTYAGTPCYQLRMHSPVSCFQYVLSGSGVIICDDRIFTVNQGDSFLLLEGKNQIYYSNPDNQFERIWINFKGILSNSLIDIYRLKDIVVFKNTDTSDFLKKIQSICHRNTEPTAYEEETSREFLKLIQFLSHNKENNAPVSNTAKTIRSYLDLHIMDDLRLSDLSKQFSYTKEHIIRTFKRTYGVTPHQYIIQSRIRIAMIMLKSTDDTIYEISEKLRFSEPHHFSETFKAHVGLRPSQYRKASRK